MKIFGIGLSKTGTTSLARALEILGYKTRDYPGISHYEAGNLSSIDPVMLEQHDAFTDTPIPSFYRELDARFPGSKFILTVREMDGWLKSCKKQFNQKHADKQSKDQNQIFVDLYGCAAFDEEKFKAGYHRFVSSVLNYFKDRSDDLLVLDVSAGEGWEIVCPFVGKSIPDNIPFPRANVTQIRWMKIEDIIDIANQAGREITRAFAIIDKGKPPATDTYRFASLSDRFILSIKGGVDEVRRNARKRVSRIVVRRLKELNPNIPVVAPGQPMVPYHDRQAWNHFWLVDPLEEATDTPSASSLYVLSIALVEDRRPILGLVYAPVAGRLYYSVWGKGSYLLSHTDPAIPIDPEADVSALKSDDLSTVTGSKPVAMCRFAAGEARDPPKLEGTMEWQTAGAQAVLTGLRKLVLDQATHAELTYNKEGFINGVLSIE